MMTCICKVDEVDIDDNNVIDGDNDDIDDNDDDDDDDIDIKLIDRHWRTNDATQMPSPPQSSLANADDDDDDDDVNVIC